MENKLYRSRTNKKIAGVCGGISEYCNVDVTVVRLLCALAVIFAGAGLLAYLIAMIIIPSKPDYIQ